VSDSPAHGEDAIREGDCVGELAVVDVAEGLGDLGGGNELLGAPGGDAPEVQAVATDAGAALGQAQRDGGSGASDLVGEFAVVLGDLDERLAERADECE
jgi:hypothetical protein